MTSPYNPIGEILAESVSVVEGRRFWRSGIQADPLALRCHISLALLQPDEQAVVSLNHAEELLHLKGRQHPALISLYEWRAFLLDRLGCPEAAIVDLQRCPVTLRNRLRLVALYAHIGRYDAALALYDQILMQVGQEKPDKSERILREIHRGRGWIYSHRGEWAAAADALQQALGLDSGDVATAQDLGYARGRLDAQRRVRAEDDELLERFRVQSQDAVEILQKDMATRLNRLDRRIQRVRRDLLGNLKVVRRITVKLLASANTPGEQEAAFAVATDRIHEMVESLVRERNMEYYSQQIRKELPDPLIWAQLSAPSKRSLAHAELLYRENIEVVQFDFTPVLVEICRVFEQEFYEQLLHPLAHYAEGYHVAAGEQCLRVASFVWDISRPEFLSLGKIAAILDGLSKPDVSPGLLLFIQGAWGGEFCGTLDEIRQGLGRLVELRNKAAQSTRLDRPLIDAVRHLFFGNETNTGLLTHLVKGYPVYRA
ncbi:MAG: hypothetical protein EXR62_12045 [Chloroflexi bacterium]|nr:hypothetical protein [Chloroflexota bacterium]